MSHSVGSGSATTILADTQSPGAHRQDSISDQSDQNLISDNAKIPQDCKTGLISQFVQMSPAQETFGYVRSLSTKKL